MTCSAGAAPTVTRLDLNGYHHHGFHPGLKADIGALAPLVLLAYLDLSYTGVTGDVKGLVPLVQLTVLYLSGTKVAGEAASLAPLVRLTSLWLWNTAVTGCAAFCAASHFPRRCDC